MILDAVIPLLIEYGADVTSRQIAEAAGIAEGTVFRAFGDKDTLLRAAADKFLDPETVRVRLRKIDPNDDLQSKVAAVIAIQQTRFSGVLRVVAAVGHKPQGKRDGHAETDRLIFDLFAPDAAVLSWQPDRIMHFVRLLAFASSVPEINQIDTPFSVKDLAELVVNGISTIGRDALLPSEDSEASA